MIGRTLSHYEITAQLGAGGMGEVYLARDTKLDRRVALKVLPAEVAADESRLRRLQREAKALAALDHPNIVTLYSVAEADGVHFLTMAHVEGLSVDELIPAEGLPVDRLLELAVPFADALRAAHERGIIHRDLKPSNVMVDGEGRLRVLDFGLARVVKAMPAASRETTMAQPEPVTVRGMVLGTVPYMSPEQAEGKPVGASSDIFSLGVVLYEMATGRRPFAGETGAALISSILRDTPPAVTAVRPELPEALGRVVGRCLEKVPQDRYPSAGELRDDLESLRREMHSGALVGRLRARRVRRWAPGVAAAVAVALAATVGMLTWRGGEETAEPGQEAVAESSMAEIRSIAVLPLRNLSGDPEQEYFVDGMTEALITDLSKIGALRVIARSSVMPFKGADTPLAEIASALGVDAVIEGSVLREGEQVGINAQLIESSSERVLWGEAYTRDLTSILAVQAEMATAIARGVQVALSPEEIARLSGVKTVDPVAYEAVLKGFFYLQQFTPRGFDSALQQFERAVEIAPDYAPGYLGIDAVWGFRNQAGMVVPREVAPLRREIISRALALDDSLADAHLALAGFRTWYEWDWAGGEEAFLRAIELNPNSAEARIFYSHLLSIMGRFEEGTAQAKKALALDPLNPFFRTLAGVQMYMVGRIDDGVALIRRTLDEYPSLAFGHDLLRGAYHQQGLWEQAYAETKARYSAMGDRQLVEALEKGWEDGGYGAAMERAAELLERRSLSQHVGPLAPASLYLLAGRLEKVFPWLERAFELRAPNMPYIGTLQWRSSELKDDPRYIDLLRRMNLPVGEPSTPPATR